MGEKVVKKRENARFSQKNAFFLAKNLQNEIFALYLHHENEQWWIHLRARIHASHA